MLAFIGGMLVGLGIGVVGTLVALLVIASNG